MYTLYTRHTYNTHTQRTHTARMLGVRMCAYIHIQTYDESVARHQRAWAAVNCQRETRFEYMLFNL